MSELTYEEMLKINDIQRKMKIVKNVVAACYADKDANVSYLTSVANTPNSISIVNSIRYYTGLDLKTITTYLNQYLQNPPPIRTFAMYSLKHSKGNAEEKTWDRVLRENILALYLKDFDKLPNLALLKMRDSEFFGKQCENVEEIKLNLEKSFYMLHKVEGTSKAIIIERPEKTYERFRYLETVDRYRCSDLDFVYVNRNKLTPLGKYFWDFIAVSPKVGVLGIFKPTKLEDKDKNKELESWMLHEILPLILSPSVLVLEDTIELLDFMTVPSMRSLKVDMINWLTFNNIAHRSNMHRAELYELIKKSKRHLPDKIYYFDTLVNAKGHKVLRQPKGVTCLNYFQNVWLQVIKNPSDKNIMSKAYHANSIVVNKNLEHWRLLESIIIQRERKIYSEDIIFEHIIDKILTLGKYSPESKNLFDECDNAPSDSKILDMIEM